MKVDPILTVSWQADYNLDVPMSLKLQLEL